MASEAVPVSIDPFSKEALSDPFAYHDELLGAGPVLWLERLGVFGVARYAEVTQVLDDHDVFVSGRGVGLADFAKEEPFRPPSLLLEVDPPLHTRTRTLMNKIVALPVLKALEEEWRAKAQVLVAAQVRKGSFDAVVDLAEQFPMAVFPDAVGLMDEGREHLLTYAFAVFNAFGPRNDVFEDSMDAAKAAFEWVAAACKRENLKAEGWGMEVYRAADRGECAPEEAERLVRSFLSAGVDTTISGFANLMYAFCQFPDEWTKMATGGISTRRVFNEGLRWRSTVQTFFRTTSRDTEIASVTIPAGSKVITFLAAANRDPRKWPDAKRFSIERNASGHVGFGHGVHNCLGQMVARIETDALLAAMGDQIERIEAAGPAKVRLNNTLCTLSSLPVIITPKQASAHHAVSA